MMVLRECVEIIVSDVDDTLAEIYTPASETIIAGINELLSRGKKFFFISGQSEKNIHERIVKYLKPEYRNQILLGTCSGAEVWGYINGEMAHSPFYSIYEQKLTDAMKETMRIIISNVIEALGLITIKTMPRAEFNYISNGIPEMIMYEDRRAQITFEVINACNLSDEQLEKFKTRVPWIIDCRDLRHSIIAYVNKEFEKNKIPITARLAGNFAIDFAVEGVTKTTAIESIMYGGYGRDYWEDIPSYSEMEQKVEIWGDKFSAINGGTDFHMCEAFSNDVLAIDFRRESVDEIPTSHNISLWDGECSLCKGVEEYMMRSGII